MSEQIKVQTSEQVKLPVVALRALTILPEMVIHFDLSRRKSVRAVEQAMAEDQKLFVITQKDPNSADPDSADMLYQHGTVVQIKQVVKLPNKLVRVMVRGLCRGELKELFAQEEYLFANVETDEYAEQHDDDLDSTTLHAMREGLLGRLTSLRQVNPKVSDSLVRIATESPRIGGAIYEVAAIFDLPYQNKQRILDGGDLKGRYMELSLVLEDQMEMAKIHNEFQEHLRTKADKNHREVILREQMDFLRSNLGDKQDVGTDADDFMKQVQQLLAPEEVKEKLEKEIRRFRVMSETSSESAVLRNYIETMLELPWDKVSEENVDIRHAAQILDEDHYGLEKVKEKIIEYLAVRSLTSKGDCPILCLVGPPGTGKTSIAKSVARALERKYVRVCLGGVRDEAEIRGHRRTYVSALPGRIVEGIKNAGTSNPLMLLDEIDKTGTSHQGDTAAALLEVLDSEQNVHFRDHYIEVPMDLSRVLFLATANNPSEIPRPLLDRMEIVEITSYTANEKLHIAKEHLVGKQLEKNGLTKQQLHITTGALKKIISSYTREAGVRDLERRIGQLCRKSAKRILDGEESIRVTGKNLQDFLGKEKYEPENVSSKAEIGLVNGLAWTAVGGTTLEVEVNLYPGKGNLQLTGQLGDVMKESAQAALSYVRSIGDRLGLDAEMFEKSDIHIHVPEGATPKDGPSAGITMTTALVSALTKIPVKAKIAMTGEVTLRGRVLPIGGLKEKLLAAKMAGVKTVLIPKKNEKDLGEIDNEITEDLEIIPVETMDQVLELALERSIHGN